MTVATPTTFEIKSANFPLVALLLKSTDLSALAREMTLRFGDIPDFFDQDALVIDKPLRSGQQVYARGRDLVVLAMVNAGAEVIADGHIHVYAPLRGRAIAGARGNGEARIFALNLEAELLSIAGIYRTSENPLPPEVTGRPTQVRLVDGPDGEKLVMTPML